MEPAHSFPHHLLGLPYGVPWLDQVFSSAGLTYHAITLISLFATREGFSYSSFAFDPGLNGLKAHVALGVGSA